MQITSTLTFAAPCDRVADMLVNPSFAEHVGQRIKASNVTTTQIDGGMSSALTLATPEVARRIIGPQMTVTETVVWQDGASDGSRLGRMTVSVQGVPASMDGPLRLSPTDSGAEVIYTTDFTVRVPLVGKKIEEMARKHLTSIMRACQEVGDTWLNPKKDQPES